MKAESVMPSRDCSDSAALASQQADSCQGYEHQQEIKSKLPQELVSSADFPREDIESGIPKRFEKIVGKYPDRLAVKTPSCSFTYRDLNAMANRVAWSLIDYQEIKSEPVAILFDNGAELIATMIGILKAGRFFVLLDPLHPKDRLASMLKDSQASLLMTDRNNNFIGQQIISGDQTFIDFASLDQTVNVDNPALQISADALAFITYTSGSTGQPKAVIQNHRNILFDSAYFVRAYPLSERDRFGHLTSGTSSAIRTALHPLMKGAAVLLFDVKAQGVKALAQWLLQERVSICPMGSPLYRSFCETLRGQESFVELRVLRLMSETIHKSDFDLYKSHFPTTCALVSGLASTETGLLRLYFMNHETSFTSDEIPLGYPIEGKDILLMDDNGNEVGIGNIGEIVVRSEYLSPGYWRRPGLTDAKFQPDPAGGTKRLYYTGDLGLMLSDGCLVHKGRKDFRVKVRGYGVDLVEVERILVEHPAIQKAVVVAAKNDSDENYLIAYFTSNVVPPPSVNVLRSYLSGILPDYMVPSFFVQLDAFPLTSNGKINRNALPNPDRLRPNLNAPYVEPRNPLEKAIAKIWAEVLGIDRVGVRDDFFDLGGHSLLAAKLFALIEKTFGKELSPPTLLYARTVEQLAVIIEQRNAPAPRSLLVPLLTKGSKPPFFWAGGYQSNIHLPRLLGQDQPLYGLLNQCHDGQRQLYSRLEDIAAHHLKEIRAIQPRGPYFLGGFCFGGMVAFEMAQQLTRLGEEVALLFCLDLGTLVNVKALTDRLADSPIRLTQTESFRDEFFRHLSALARLKLRELLTYVGVRVQDRTNALISTVRNVGKELIYRVCLLTGRPIPPSLQLDYHIVRVDRIVMRRYKPERYAGRMVHIKAGVRTYNPELVAMLSSGELETYELPCDHGGLVREPYISIWAEWLKSDLQKTEKPQRAVHPSLSYREVRGESIVG